MKKIILLVPVLAGLALSALLGNAQPPSSESAVLLAQNGNSDSTGGRNDPSGQPETPASGAAQNRQANNANTYLRYGGAGGGIGGGGYSYSIHNLRYPAAGEKPLIVRTSEMNPKDEANLEEDLAVMAHILSKTLDDLPSGPSHMRTAMGIDLFVTPNADAIRSMYVEGVGALFLLNVGFPLVAPASAAPEEKPSGDSAWEEARQELYGQSTESQSVSTPGEEFSEEKVGRLKEAVLRALKNASNIRGLEGDITVCVLGGAHSGPVTAAGNLRRSTVATGPAMNQLLVATDGAPVQGTVLTIKVSKNDVDALAKGELKFADFQQRAHVAAYSTAASGSSGAGVVGLPMTR